MHNESEKSRLNVASIASYVGAVLLILVMARFMTMNFEGLKGGWVTAMATAYAVVFAGAGSFLWFKKGARVPGGLLVTIAVWMAPIAVYGVQKGMGLWKPPWSAHTQYFIDHRNLIIMALGTIAASLLALRYVKFAFLSTPIIISLWAITGNVVALARGTTQTSFHEMNIVTVVFGLALICTSVVIGKVFQEDYGFWFNLLGTALFWFAVILGRSDDSEFGIALVYGLANMGLIAVGILIRRPAMLLFGATGIFFYITHLARAYLDRSPLYLVAVFLSGAAIIGSAFQYRKHRSVVDDIVARHLPWRRKLLRESRSSVDSRTGPHLS